MSSTCDKAISYYIWMPLLVFLFDFYFFVPSQRRRRQQQNRVQLEGWKDSEAKTQAQIAQAAQEALQAARRASSVDPGTI
jgi:hypothetical protein